MSSWIARQRDIEQLAARYGTRRKKLPDESSCQRSTLKACMSLQG
ncbi:MAG: hypothetical protein SOI56_00460 [Eubacteriales bacterium]